METFGMAFICTGNRFRSVLAEAFVRRLTLGLPVSVESYGTLELEGTPALPEAIELARASAVDVSQHTSRCLWRASLGELDLVVGFDQTHVREAVVTSAAQREHTFTARHLARLLEKLPAPPDGDVVAGARALVRQADELRASEMPPTAADDMRDPLGRPWREQRETAAEIRKLSLLLAARLFGATDAGVLPAAPDRLLRGPLSLLRRFGM